MNTTEKGTLSEKKKDKYRSMNPSRKKAHPNKKQGEI